MNFRIPILKAGLVATLIAGGAGSALAADPNSTKDSTAIDFNSREGKVEPHPKNNPGSVDESRAVSRESAVETTRAIRTALEKSDRLGAIANQISVTAAKDGRVKLTGNVPTSSDVDAVVQCAKEAAPNFNIVSELKVDSAAKS